MIKFHHLYKSIRTDIFRYLAQLKQNDMLEYPFGLIVNPVGRYVLQIYGREEFFYSSRYGEDKYMDLLLGIDISLPRDRWIICQTEAEFESYYTTLKCMQQTCFHSVSLHMFN
ncbi:MAG TPA: hypothetical protein VKA68_13205 [bacterium]|nr:hypothetical protein [bacterium]